jgi:dihydroflavonol-4-reductase
MKVFITGGTGFIGRHLVRRLAQTEHAICCLVRKTIETKELRDLGAQLIIGDVTDRSSLSEGMRGCDWVINLANVYSFWESDKTIYRRVNVEGTRNIMECALENGVSKVVHVSAIVIYGKPKESPIREETSVAPIRLSDYAQTKYEGELIAWQLYQEKGLPLVVVYPCAVLGSGDNKLTGETIRRLINNRLPARIFDNTVYTYVHVDDVVEVILKAAEKLDNVGEKYIVGNVRISFGELYELISDVSGVAPPKLRMPDFLVMFSARALTWLADKINRPPLLGMATDAMRVLKDGLTADGSKVEHELGIVYTPIRKAIEEELAWHSEP